MLPETRLANGACSLWQEELLLDYTIEVEDEKFRVHKVVMASVSDYFKAMLTGGMTESREDRVRLVGLTSLAVQDMLTFIYTGEFGSAKAGLDQLMHCAMYLQIPTAVEACIASLCEEVDIHNCFRIRSIFKANEIKQGLDHTGNFIKQNIEAISEDCNPEKLTYDDVMILQEHWERSEWELFSITKKWLIADPERMKEHVNDLMSRIRFCLMSPTEVASIKDMDIFCDSDGPWHDLVEKALQYHNLPTHQKVLDESEQSTVRTEHVPVCFGLRPSISNHLFTVQKDKSWILHETINPPDFHERQLMDPFVHYTAANNFLIVCDYSGDWYIYDPRNSTWSTMASLGVPREQFALVHHDQYLYALGGVNRGSMSYQATDVIEKYDYKTNTWVIISSKMPALMTNHHAFSVGSRIYITDACLPGDGSDDDENREGFDYFDPDVGEWSHKDIPTRCWQTGVMELDGEKVLAGIDPFHFRVNYYKPSVDKWLVCDHCPVTRLSEAQYEFGLILTKGDTIFFLCFSRSNERDSFNRLVYNTMYACEEWIVGKKGPTFNILDEFPIVPTMNGSTFEVPDNSFCVLLAHQYKDTDIWKQAEKFKQQKPRCPIHHSHIPCTICGS